MFTFWGVMTAITVGGGVPIVGGLWIFERWRSDRRNRRGECAACGTSWQRTRTEDSYLIQGRLVCEDCARAARRRLPWHFGMLATAVALATGLTALKPAVGPMVLFPVGSVLVLTALVVLRMKLANRSAQRRIAEGAFPALESLILAGATGHERPERD